MKSNINLYQSRFEPRIDYLSLSSVSLPIGVVALIVLITGSIYHYLASSAEAEYVKLLERNRTHQSQIDELQAEVTNWKADPALIKKVEDIKLDLSKQRRVLEELAARAPLRFKGFSILLDDLADKHESDLWIESMAVSETNMTFNGQVSSPQAFPRWLQRLSETSSFRGRSFAAARVYMDQDDALKFELSTRRTASAKAAAPAQQNAPGLTLQGGAQ